MLDFWTNKARIGVNNGATFGEEGCGFVRINIGTSRSVIEQAMAQLKEAYEKL
jgi:cystathionine beta-lyase